jgi:hypothetical protein
MQKKGKPIIRKKAKQLDLGLKTLKRRMLKFRKEEKRLKD